MASTEVKDSFAVHGFEAPAEVLEAMEAADNSQKKISEENLADLQYVDLSHHWYIGVKWALDTVVSVLCLILLLIPILLIALLIYADDPGKVVFSQNRVGKNGKRFRIYKFRTMRMDTPRYLSTSNLENPEKWITRFGRLLRKTSLDEILQFINVIKGDMSLIGPRPLISDEFEIHEMRARFGVYQLRPGITGLAQVMGRDTVSPEDKVRWDVKYLQRFGFRQDIRILVSTCLQVVRGKNIVEGTESVRQSSASTEKM